MNDFTYAHRCQICNEKSFFFKKKMYAGMPIFAQDVYYEDGTQPKPGDPIECKKCKNILPTLLSARMIKL